MIAECFEDMMQPIIKQSMEQDEAKKVHFQSNKA